MHNIWARDPRSDAAAWRVGAAAPRVLDRARRRTTSRRDTAAGAHDLSGDVEELAASRRLPGLRRPERARRPRDAAARRPDLPGSTGL